MPGELPTVDVVVGAERGPIVAILGGVHGDEYEGVLAAAQLRSRLPSELLRGEVRFAAPAHPAAWSSRTRDSPVDGANLARAFPGRPDGGATERVAHLVTERVIRGADLLIDLHSAGSGFDMPLLCGYHDSPDRRGQESRRLADVFAARFTWAHGGLPAPGRSLSVAFDLGIPAVYVESRGGLSVRTDDLRSYVDGVRRVLATLGMIADAPEPRHVPIDVSGDGDTDAGMPAPASGYLVVDVEAGAPVRRAEVLAAIVQPDGRTTARIRAPHDGYVMLLRRDARVSEGDTVAIVACGSDG